WQAEGRALVETYETLFPEIAPAPLDLIVEEYRIRHRLGDKPELDSYQVRFPDLFPQIEERARERPPEQSAPRFQQPEPPPPPHPEPAAVAPTPAPAVTSLFPPGYTPVDLIGRGNFGEVWKAEAPGGIEVAIKVVTQPVDTDTSQRE